MGALDSKAKAVADGVSFVLRQIISLQHLCAGDSISEVSHNCSKIFGEDTTLSVFASAEQSPEHINSSTGMRINEGEFHRLGLLG